MMNTLNVSSAIPKEELPAPLPANSENDATEDIVTINSVFERKETLPFLPNNKKQRILIVTLSSVAVIYTFFCIWYAFHLNTSPENNPAEKLGIFSQLNAEPPAQIPVPKTNETLNFKKSSYKVEAGKKIKVSCKYTPKDSAQSTSSPKITYSSNNIAIALVDKDGNVTGKKVGTTSIVAVSDTGIYTTVPVTVTVPKAHKIKYVPYINQSEKYPSGCESVSSVMLLQYLGFKISVDDFIDKYLPQGTFSFNKEGEMNAPDPYTAFLGSPYDSGSLGCYPNVIKKAMNSYFKAVHKEFNYHAVDLSGTSMRYLVENYVANNQPVVIWATMFMAQPVVTEQWIIKGADKDSPYKDGDVFEWKANEHCMLLTGYDEDFYYLHDPLSDKETAYYKDVFEERFETMGRFALVVDKTT